MWASRGAETGRGLSAGFRLCGWLPGAVEGHCVGSAEISQRHSFRHHRGSSASDLTQPRGSGGVHVGKLQRTEGRHGTSRIAFACRELGSASRVPGSISSTGSVIYRRLTGASLALGPSGKKFRSKPQLSRYLGNAVDLGCFDFRTGKMMPSKMQKNKQRLRSETLSMSKGKPDLNTALPIRQTASIFKQPVTKVVNHPSNKVKTDPQRATEQPRQLFWERRLKGLRSSDVTDEVLRTMELPKGLQSVGPDSSDETLLSAIASALHMSSGPITGQTSTAAEKNPAIWLNTSQPLCKSFIVTDDDIR
ncbi:methyl-CpG-binding domain protein 2 [Silurus asotus]|uniref:Methyl-CpG-binding domain protein 2 n=1 Tax=Silurus asotus TaxID=30991 RepID=A0AAD5AGW5_SILAS|nr:methyl-CpG-binding domain protein 2 [Silurus asotus]